VGLASRARLRYPGVAVHPLPSAALVALLALLPAGCDERAAAGTPDAAPPPSAAPSAPASAPRPAPSASASASVDKPPLEVLKLVFTSDVKDKKPTDKLDWAAPGQRVYVHLTVRNRGAEARPISLVFRVNGEQRSKVDLKVEPSWSYRTWGYNTLRKGDQTGALEVDVRDDTGTSLQTARLPIRNDPPRPPVPKPEPLDD
jgi:hypothetical protein